MATVLKDAKITAISLVDRGANGRRFFLYKRHEEDHTEAVEGDQEFDFSMVLPIIKGFTTPAKDTWEVAYCVVAVPGEVDLQGDVWTQEEIRKACHGFMENSQVINYMHEDLKKIGMLAENAIALQDMKVGDETIPVGSWYIGIKPDAARKNEINKGQLTGVSVQGAAQREPIFGDASKPGEFIHTLTKDEDGDLNKTKSLEEAGTSNQLNLEKSMKTLDGKALKETDKVYKADDHDTIWVVMGFDKKTNKVHIANTKKEFDTVSPLSLITPATNDLKKEDLSNDGSCSCGGDLNKTKSPEEVIYKFDGKRGIWKSIHGFPVFYSPEDNKIIARPIGFIYKSIEDVELDTDNVLKYAEPELFDAKGSKLRKGMRVSHILDPEQAYDVVELFPQGVVLSLQKSEYTFEQGAVPSNQVVVVTNADTPFEDLANALYDDYDENPQLQEALKPFGVERASDIYGAIRNGDLKEDDLRKLVQLVDGPADYEDDQDVEGTVATGQQEDQNFLKQANEDSTMANTETLTPEERAAKLKLLNDSMTNGNQELIDHCSKCGLCKRPKHGAADEETKGMINPDVPDAHMKELVEKYCSGTKKSVDREMSAGMAVAESTPELVAKSEDVEVEPEEALGYGSRLSEAGEIQKGWLPAGMTQGKLDDSDFAWLSDAYKAGKESKSTGRKLPFKIKGKVDAGGWRAAWAAARGAMGGTDFTGGPAKEAVLATLMASKPEDINVSKQYEEELLGKRRGQRLGTSNDVLEIQKAVKTGKTFIGPDGKRYIASKVTDTSVSGFAGGKSVTFPLSQVQLSKSFEFSRNEQSGERLPFC